MTHAVVLIKAERDAIPTLGGRLAVVEGVAEAYSVTGEWDYVAILGVGRAEVGDADPLAAIQDALDGEPFDEIVISTLPHRISRWLRLDLPSKARGLGLPVTHVQADVMPEEELVAAAA